MNPEELLKKGITELGFTCSEEQIQAFMTFLRELKKWNRTYNLTAITSDNDIIMKHFLDSLLFLNVFPSHVHKVADAGTGAGFPGVPIKLIRPDIDCILIESSRKKTAFLKHLVRVLGLSGVSILQKRIEDLGEDFEKGFDVVVSRATFRVKDFLKKACPYVKDDGILVLSKGRKVSEEIKGLEKKDIERRSIALPLSNIQRNFIIIKCNHR
jgi:16S rRNA (guanine527-N7)-methyltransferase